MNGTMQGTIVKVFADQSACFVKPDDGGGDVFARRKESPNAPATLETGMRVSFETYRGPHGNSCAEQVTVIPNDGKHLEHGVIEASKGDFGFLRPDRENAPSVYVHQDECDFPLAVRLRVTYILTTDKAGRARAAVCRREQS